MTELHPNHEQALEAANHAAFPGLPSCMTLEEANRRVEAGVLAYLEAINYSARVDLIRHADELATTILNGWSEATDLAENYRSARIAEVMTREKM
jgi:hypothetical protein